MRRTGSARSSSTRARAPSTRWSKRRAPGGRTSPKAVRAAATSSQTELRLVNVARGQPGGAAARLRGFPAPPASAAVGPDSPEAMAVRRVPQTFREDQLDRSDLTDLTDHQRWALYARWLEHDDPAVRANAVNLPHSSGQLPAGSADRSARKAVCRGRRLQRTARRRAAGRARPTAARADRSATADSRLPAVRKAHGPAHRQDRHANAGSQFWGCSAYPDCRGACPLDGTRGTHAP